MHKGRKMLSYIFKQQFSPWPIAADYVCTPVLSCETFSFENEFVFQTNKLLIFIL
jgi:hypothetical protein